MQDTWTIKIKKRQEDLNWPLAEQAAREVPTALLMDEGVAELWYELLPGEYSRVLREDDEVAAEKMREVLLQDLQMLRQFSEGEENPLIERQEDVLICSGVSDPQSSEDSHGPAFAIQRLDEVDVLQVLGFDYCD